MNCGVLRFKIVHFKKLEDLKILCNVLGKLGFVWNDREGENVSDVVYCTEEKINEVYYIIYLDTNVISYVIKKDFEEALGDRGLEIIEYDSKGLA